MHLLKNSLFFTLFLMIRLHLSATPLVLSFDDLSSESVLEENSSLWLLHGKTVQVRGFWYSLSSSEGILAPHPHLKSCCLKAPAKIQQQLLIKGELASLPSQRALTIEGIFKIEPAYNSKGQLVRLFILEQAKEIPQSTWHISLIILGIFMTLFCIWFFSKGDCKTRTL